jgi:hypothetical protein
MDILEKHSGALHSARAWRFWNTLKKTNDRQLFEWRRMRLRLLVCLSGMISFYLKDILSVCLLDKLVNISGWTLRHALKRTSSWLIRPSRSRLSRSCRFASLCRWFIIMSHTSAIKCIVRSSFVR